MALIGRIRKHGWIFVFIALALAGFLIMDIVTSGTGGPGANQFMLGEVEGEKIDYNEFQTTERLLYGNSQVNIYDQHTYLWNYFVEKAILDKEAAQSGLSVGNAELEDLQFGNNLSPIIQQQFRDPNTGAVDRQQLANIKQTLEAGQANADFTAYWESQRKQIIKTQLQTKLSNIVSKGIFVPTWMAQMNHKLRNNKVSFEYVQVPFEEVDDAEIKVTDEDLKKYLTEHKALYERDNETRKVKYIVFNVGATAADSQAVLDRMVTLRNDFSTATDDSLFILRNYGNFDVVYYSADDLNPLIADTVTRMKVGQVYGPYIDGINYSVVKLLGQKVIPDSVKSRHILRLANTQTELITASRFIDSIKLILETGVVTFDSLARLHSQDGSAALGGELGFAGLNAMVKPFNDALFYTGVKGELIKVISNFGVHLIDIQDYKFLKNTVGYRIATLSEAIIPSEETQDKIYNQASDFTSNNRTLEAMAEAIKANPELQISESGFLEKADAYLLETGVGQTSRDIVRWAFDRKAKIGDASPDVYIYEDPVNRYRSKYLVVGLSEILKPGLASVESLRNDLTPLVRNQLKGAALQAKITSQDLSEIASQFESKIDTASDVAFSGGFIPGLGSELKVIAQAFKMDKGQVSKPIIGESGVYVVRVTDKVDDVTDGNLALMRQQVSAQQKAAMPQLLMPALVKKAKIKDNRYTFF